MMTGTERLPACPFCSADKPVYTGQSRAIYAAHMHLECRKCKHRVTVAYMPGSEQKAKMSLNLEWIKRVKQLRGAADK